MSDKDKKAVVAENYREPQRVGLEPIGHKPPFGHSDYDNSLEFYVPDCGTKAYGQFSHPLMTHEADLPENMGGEDSDENNKG